MQLPITGLELRYRAPDGEDEMAIAELAFDRPVASGIALLDRLARDAQGERIDAGALPVTDFELALVGLRRALVGPDVASDTQCTACGERMDVSFSFDALAAAAQPRRPAGVLRAPGGRESIDGIVFRLPTAADLCACEGAADAPLRLSRACIDGDAAPGARRRVQTAMARLAPALSRTVAVPCAACGAVLSIMIHVPGFVVREAARAAAGIFEDVHWLASAYGWREPDILALPRARRQRYAARARHGD